MGAVKSKIVASEKPPFVYWASLWGCGASFPLVYLFRDIFDPKGASRALSSIGFWSIP